VVERAAYLATTEIIGAADVLAALPPEAAIEPPRRTSRNSGSDLRASLPPGLAGIGLPFEDDPGRPLLDRVDAFEAWLCRDALERTRFRQKEAATLLGLTYDQFRQRYRKYNLGKD